MSKVGNVSTITLGADTRPIMLFIEMLTEFIKVTHRPIEWGEFTSEFLRLETDDSAASAGKQTVVFYPSDTFLHLLPTLLTGDWKLTFIKDVSHKSNPLKEEQISNT